MKEIWKGVPDYEGLYKVSNLGNIVSLNGYGHGIIRPLKIRICKAGYCRVTLSKNKQKQFTSVHVLVAKAFIPNPENKPQVNHIDGDKMNNTVENLEWVTCKENINHAIRTGLREKISYKPPKGDANKSSKPIVQYDLNGNFVKRWECQSDAARFYKCDTSRLVNCAKGREPSAKGFIWRYVELPIQKRIFVPFNGKAPHKIIKKSSDGVVLGEWKSFREAAHAVGCCTASVYGWCSKTHIAKDGSIWDCVYI